VNWKIIYITMHSIVKNLKSININEVIRKVVSIIIFLVVSSSITTFSQDEIVDQVVAVIGDNMVLQSDVENQVLQIRSQGSLVPKEQLRCEVFEDGDLGIEAAKRAGMKATDIRSWLLVE